MYHLVLVFLGAGCGGVTRHLLGTTLHGHYAERLGGLPVGTLAVNVIGSALIGVVVAAWGEHPIARMLIITGFLGGFTTFSSFSRESIELLQSGRSGLAALYIALSVLCCLIGAWAGFALGRALI
nr:fluoride efflux transporter CrcB [Planctomycetota bacterium]